MRSCQENAILLICGCESLKAGYSHRTTIVLVSSGFLSETDDISFISLEKEALFGLRQDGIIG